MKYAPSYLNASQLAERIRQGAAEGKRVKATGGLAAREERRSDPFAGMDLEQVRARYMNLVQDIFKRDEEEEEVAPAETSESTGLGAPLEGDSEYAFSGDLTPAGEGVSMGYGEGLSQKTIETIIAQEAVLRNMDPKVAIAIFRAEGAGAYQSQIAREGKGSLGGKEASFGPYQLYTGGGLGNVYEQETGRNLLEDNTLDGVTTQIRFALDKAAEGGWSPWYGREAAGVGVRQGLENAKPVYNWKR